MSWFLAIIFGGLVLGVVLICLFVQLFLVWIPRWLQHRDDKRVMQVRHEREQAILQRIQEGE